MAGLGPVAPASADPGPGYIDQVTWVSDDGLPTLRVFPSAAGRTAAGSLGKTAIQTDAAWRQVLALAPDADTPSLRAQFLCHWRFAELAQPGKNSWDLEAWRPDVDDATMVAAGCNPGGSGRG